MTQNSEASKAGTSVGPYPLIPVYEPHIGEREKAYVNDCLETSWISSLGKYVEQFEMEIARVSGVAHGVAVTNGTVALHLAHHCLGLQPGDEVLVPAFTYIASVNTIAQTGAKPILVESRSDDWLLDIEDARSKITHRTKGIVAVHLYGAVCDMKAIMTLAREHGLYVIEDCAESLGATRDGQPAGSFGNAATFSFFGNKTITTGEGGMVVTDDLQLATNLRLTKGQGQDPNRRYWHDRLGFNYRMTNIAAAIGCAQMERLSQILDRKSAIADRYKGKLSSLPVKFQKPAGDVVSSNWLVSLLLPNGANRDRVMTEMHALGVDTRPVFHCTHHMPMYANLASANGNDLSVAEHIAKHGLSLPSYPTMTDETVDRVCDALERAVTSL